jgi:NAD(P)-dependent dehydrogenase (short-subunit alcohol dehydrogenase family)
MMNKNIVIVGASRGIGRELVHLFAKDENNHVIALSRNVKAMSDFDNLKNVTYKAFDISSPTVNKDLTQLLADIKSVDILINNAGKLVNKPFLELTKDDIESCYQTNAIGVMLTTQVVVPKMEKEGGHIVNISTMGAFQGSVKFPGLSAYSTSKAGVVSFTELFAEEFKDTKIKMNCLCLGAVQTEMLEEAFPGFEAPLSAKEMAAYISEFAQSGHKYMNGKVLPVSLSTP